MEGVKRCFISGVTTAITELLKPNFRQPVYSKFRPLKLLLEPVPPTPPPPLLDDVMLQNDVISCLELFLIENNAFITQYGSVAFVFQ